MCGLSTSGRRPRPSSGSVVCVSARDEDWSGDGRGRTHWRGRGRHFNSARQAGKQPLRQSGMAAHLFLQPSPAPLPRPLLLPPSLGDVDPVDLLRGGREGCYQREKRRRGSEASLGTGCPFLRIPFALMVAKHFVERSYCFRAIEGSDPM